ncbi:MAG: ketol-acid reductoisomerase [Thaumarchaeota archaeon]|nr:MAG: ketol-acid reductoisomerase [Nitrososphaerota archaeon]
MSPLKDKTVAVIGYGNQGRAQALNMRDSGIDVIVGVRVGGRSWKKAEEDGFKPMSIEEASRKADIIHILIPDTVQPTVYKEKIEPELREGKTLGFSHGYNIHFKLIKPPSWVDVILIAPKSPGKRMREVYLNGGGVPALVAVGQDYTGEAMKKALAMAKAIGCSRAGVIETTFAEETETDLFGEQAVLVGGVMELIKKGFEVLIEAGYQPEISYFEVCNELKLIVDLIYREGLSGMLEAVSETARYGGLIVGPKIIDESVKEKMKEALQRIRSGEFEESWTGNPSAGELLKEKLEEIKRHPIENVGERIRKLMKFGEG